MAINEATKLEWETVPTGVAKGCRGDGLGLLRRLKVVGGWLVSLGGPGLAFVPDTHHEWETGATTFVSDPLRESGAGATTLFSVHPTFVLSEEQRAEQECLAVRFAEKDP